MPQEEAEALQGLLDVRSGDAPRQKMRGSRSAFNEDTLGRSAA